MFKWFTRENRRGAMLDDLMGEELKKNDSFIIIDGRRMRCGHSVIQS